MLLLEKKTLRLYLNAQEREHAASKVRKAQVDVIMRMMAHKAQFPSALAHLRAIIAMIALSRLSTSQLLMITKEVVSQIKVTMIAHHKGPADADNSQFNQSSQSLRLQLDPDQSRLENMSGGRLVQLSHDDL